MYGPTKVHKKHRHLAHKRRKESAAVRQEIRDARSITQQLCLIKTRPGESKKEVLRLTELRREKK